MSNQRSTLLSLTIHEAIVCDQNLDVEGRERALSDARDLLHAMFNLANDSLGRAQFVRTLADARFKLLRKLGEKVEKVEDDGGVQSAANEDSAAMLVAVALPAERQRIRDLLKLIPDARRRAAPASIHRLCPPREPGCDTVQSSWVDRRSSPRRC